MKIADLSQAETGTKIHNLFVVVKRPKSKFTLNNETTQECVLADETCEINAEVLLQNTNYGTQTLIRNESLMVISGELQAGANGRKLYIFEYDRPTAAEPPEQDCRGNEMPKTPDWDKIARGKTKCNIVCALLSAGFSAERILDSRKQEIEKLINYIFE